MAEPTFIRYTKFSPLTIAYFKARIRELCGFTVEPDLLEKIQLWFPCRRGGAVVVTLKRQGGLRVLSVEGPEDDSEQSYATEAGAVRYVAELLKRDRSAP